MVPVGPGRCPCPERGCWLPGTAAVSQSRGHPSARSSGPQQHGRVLQELLLARMVLVPRYNQLHGISAGGEGNFIWKQIGTELVGNELCLAEIGCEN